MDFWVFLFQLFNPCNLYCGKCVLSNNNKHQNNNIGDINFTITQFLRLHNGSLGSREMGNNRTKTLTSISRIASNVTPGRAARCTVRDRQSFFSEKCSCPRGRRPTVVDKVWPERRSGLAKILHPSAGGGIVRKVSFFALFSAAGSKKRTSTGKFFVKSYFTDLRLGEEKKKCI